MLQATPPGRNPRPFRRPDIWGGVSRQIENLEALKENQRFMNEATFLTLTSNIAAGAVQEASLRAQIDTTEQLIKISKDILRIIRLQLEAGQVSGLEVAAQEALVAQTEATLPPLRKALYQQRDALIVLSGHLPGEGLPERFEFKNFKLPRKLPMTLPSDLVSQRPDVRASEENFHASCALVGVAIANRLPQVSLTGDIGRSGIAFNQLFSNNPAFYFYTGIASATQVLFDSVRRKPALMRLGHSTDLRLSPPSRMSPMLCMPSATTPPLSKRRWMRKQPQRKPLT